MGQEEEILAQVQEAARSVTEEQVLYEMAQLDSKIEALQQRKATWGAILTVKRTQRDDANGSQGSRITQREAVKRVLGEKPDGTVMKLFQIGTIMRARGWLGTDENSLHRLQMTASKMTKRQELERVSTGYYKLPQAHTEDGESEG